MSIVSDIIRGHTETIILGQLAKYDSYGYEINKKLQTITNNEYFLKDATLYSAFKRLEESGLVKSYWGEENTGARRRYYSITELGRDSFFEQKKNWDYCKDLIDKMIG